MEGEWLCYVGGQFNGGKIDHHVTEMTSLKKGEWL